MTTGQRIKAARKKAGMTQAALAEKLGISYVNISQLEKDQRNPKLETLQRIAKALGVSISNLLPPDNYWEDESGIGHTEPQVVEHEGPLQRAEVVERSATPEELEALLAKLQDGKPLLLGPDELAKLKSTPKEQIAAALDEVGQEEQKHIVRISAPLYKLRGVSPERQEQLKALANQAAGQTGRPARFNKRPVTTQPEAIVHEEPIGKTEVVTHNVATMGLENLVDMFRAVEPTEALSPSEMSIILSELAALEKEKREKQKREREKREATIVALKNQMEKIRQRYGPTAFPEFDELEHLLYKFQSDAITQGEQEQIKTLLETVQNRLKEYGEAAPSPPSTLSRQDEELRERWSKLSLSEIFVIPGNHDIDPARKEQISTLKKRILDEGLLSSACFVEAIDSPKRRIATALGKLNEEGQEKAAERVEELAEIPRYQRQEPAQKLTKEELRESLKQLGMDKLLPDGPQDTPAPQDGKDTTPAEAPPADGSQEQPEGRIQSITMICPICGQHLRGDLSTGEAYCNYCKRSFPLPQILK